MKTINMDYQTIADELKKVETEIDSKRAELKPLEEAKDELRISLISALKASRLQAVRMDTGEAYTIASRTNIGVKDEILASLWASKHDCMRLDLIKAKKILIHELKIPEGFEQTETEYISIKRANSTQEE